MNLLKQPCRHCGTDLEFDAERLEGNTYTILCPECQNPVTLCKPPPIISRKKHHRLWTVLAGVGVTLLATLIVVLVSRSGPYRDGYSRGLALGEISSDEVSASDFAEASLSNSNLNFKTVDERARWEQGFTNGFAEGRERRHGAANYQAGASAGYRWRVSGNLKPTDAELDALAYQVVGSGVRARYMWKQGFELGWMHAVMH
jgi:hypothetical protein